MKLLEASSRQFILHFLRAYPARSLAMVGLLLLSGVAEGFGLLTLLPLLELAVNTGVRDPTGLSEFMARALGTVGLQPTLGVLLALIVVAIAFKAAFHWLAMIQVGYTVAQVATNLRLDLIRGLLAAEWAYFSRHPAGHLTNAISTEAHRATSAYREATAALSSLLQITVYGIVVFLVSWEVAVAAVVTGLLVLLLLRRFVRMGRRAGESQTELMKSLVARLTDAIPGMKPIKAMGRERFQRPLLEREAEAYNEAQRRQVLAFESLHAIREPVFVLVIALGLFSLLTFGDQPLASVMVMAVLFYRMMQTLGNLQSRYQGMAVGESALWSLQEYIRRAGDAREDTPGTRPPPQLRKGIRLESLRFGYAGEPVVRDVTAFFPAGAFIAVHGPSGSGKTTLVDLAVGLLRPEAGYVYVDDVSLAEIDANAWRNQIGYVPQEVMLFHGSIHHNVTLGDTSIPRERSLDALEAAGLGEFVASLPDGMDHFVGERGTQLSGGQRQRIAIARALIGRPRLLVLDEATAALDPETELEICRTLRTLAGDVTVLAISHQGAIRTFADLVFEMAGGRLTRVERPREAMSSAEAPTS